MRASRSTSILSLTPTRDSSYSSFSSSFSSLEEQQEQVGVENWPGSTPSMPESYTPPRLHAFDRPYTRREIEIYIREYVRQETKLLIDPGKFCCGYSDEELVTLLSITPSALLFASHQLPPNTESHLKQFGLHQRRLQSSVSLEQRGICTQ
jgi:hypothetical protein